MALCYRCCLAILGGSFALSLGGCQTEPTIRSSAPPPLSSEPLLPSDQSSEITPATQPITFPLSLETPGADLLIQPGSFIRQGEVIANPVARRAALTSQKRDLEAKLSSLSNAQVVNLGTQPEEEGLALAQKRLNAAQSALIEYQQNSPWTDFARENLPLAKEEVQLTRLQNTLKQAQLNLEQAQARLLEKQSAISRVQSQKNLTQQNLQTALDQVNQQLLALQPVKSPHTGTVTKIELPEKPSVGQKVTVMVQLIPGDAPLPLTPDELPLGQPPVTPQSPGGGTASDLLPPSSDLPDPNEVLGLPDPPASGAVPNTTTVPDSGVE